MLYADPFILGYSFVGGEDCLGGQGIGRTTARRTRRPSRSLSVTLPPDTGAAAQSDRELASRRNPATGDTMGPDHQLATTRPVTTARTTR